MEEVPPLLLPPPEPEELAVPDPMEPMLLSLALLLRLLLVGFWVPEGEWLAAELPGLPVFWVEPAALPEVGEAEEVEDPEEPIEPLLPWVALPLPEAPLLLEEPCCG